MTSPVRSTPAGALPPPEQADPWSVCAGVYGKGNGLDAVGVEGTGLASGVVGMIDHGVPLAAYAGAELRFYVTNVGDVYADGTYNSPAADLAEMLPAEESRMRENLTYRSSGRGWKPGHGMGNRGTPKGNGEQTGCPAYILGAIP